MLLKLYSGIIIYLDGKKENKLFRYLILWMIGTITSRPYFAPSMSAASSALESIDIEGFVQNYSARFSEILASQVLALVEKGLNSKQ